MTPAEDFARTEFYIRLKAIHPIAACILIELDNEIEAIQARMSPEQFTALQAESRRAVARRQATKGTKAERAIRMITERQARAVRRLRNNGYEAGAVIDIGALWAANTPRDKADRRCLRNLADQGYFRQQGARNLWIIRHELYAALDAYDAAAEAAYRRRVG